MTRLASGLKTWARRSRPSTRRCGSTSGWRRHSGLTLHRSRRCATSTLLMPRSNDSWRSWDLAAKQRLLARLRAEAKSYGPSFATPGALALAVDPKTVQTAALGLIDAALVDVANGSCERLIICMSPQEGKANGSAAAHRCGC